MAAEVTEPRRRTTDGGWLCRLALRASQAWDFIDRRQIDAHVVSVVIMFGTIKVTAWAMAFAAAHADKPGADIALVIAAVLGPYSLLQGAAIKFYFDARK